MVQSLLIGNKDLTWLSNASCFILCSVAASAARDAAGQIDLNKAMEYKAKFDELTTDESSKKDD